MKGPNTSTILISGLLPTLALAYVLLVPLLTDFEAVTRTHCYLAKNFLPSVSAAIGHNFWTTIIWFACISLHTPFRFKLARQLNACYRLVLGQAFTEERLAEMSVAELVKYKRLVRLADYSHWFNWLEIVGLLVLSVFSSNGNYGELDAAGLLVKEC